MMQEGLYARLQADAGLAAFVADRIYQIEAPDDAAAYPCASYRLVGGSSEETFEGRLLLLQRVELSGFSFDAGEAVRIRAAIINAVGGWREELADGTSIKGVELINPATDLCSTDRIFRTICEFYVMYSPAF